MNLLEYIQKNESIPADLKIIIGENAEIIKFEDVKDNINVNHSRMFDDYSLTIHYRYSNYSFRHITIVE